MTNARRALRHRQCLSHHPLSQRLQSPTRRCPFPSTSLFLSKQEESRLANPRNPSLSIPEVEDDPFAEGEHNSATQAVSDASDIVRTSDNDATHWLAAAYLLAEYSTSRLSLRRHHPAIKTTFLSLDNGHSTNRSASEHSKPTSPSSNDLARSRACSYQTEDERMSMAVKRTLHAYIEKLHRVPGGGSSCFGSTRKRTRCLA